MHTTHTQTPTRTHTHTHRHAGTHPPTHPPTQAPTQAPLRHPCRHPRRHARTQTTETTHSAQHTTRHTPHTHTQHKQRGLSKKSSGAVPHAIIVTKLVAGSLDHLLRTSLIPDAHGLKRAHVVSSCSLESAGALTTLECAEQFDT